MNSIVGALALFAGIFAMSVAIYLQTFGTDAPVSYAVGYYVLGAGILLVVYELAVMYSTAVIIGGILMVLLSECVTAWTIVKSYGIKSPVDALKDWAQEVF